MKTMSYTESRARYAEVLDGVINDREEVIITRAGREPVVMVSLDEYESLRETARLMGDFLRDLRYRLALEGRDLDTSAMVDMLERWVRDYPIVSLEDLDGGVEVMVFPQVYNSVGMWLGEDTVVVVRAKVERTDDDGVRVVALELTQPDLSDASDGPIRLTMPVARCIPPLVERLREVLAAHPGTTEIHLHLTGGDHTTVLRLDEKLRVTPSPSLYGDLKALLGPSCLGQ